MTRIPWLHQVSQRWFPQRGTARRCRTRRVFAATRRCVTLRLEALEDRTLLSALISTPGDLVNAIVNANTVGGATTITLAPGTTFDFTSAYQSTNNALPVITGDITIVGNGDTIARTKQTEQDGGGVVRTGKAAPPLLPFRFFDVQGQGASLTLQNLTLKGGSVGGTLGVGAHGMGNSAQGGAIFCSGGSLNLGGVTVQSNEAEGGNGAYNSGVDPGPGGSAYGGGIYVNGGSLTLTNDVIGSNKSVGGNGGNHHAGSAVLGLSGFASVGGGGSGGGVYFSGGQLTISGTVFSSNVAQGGNGGNATTGSLGGYGGDGGPASGGGLYVSAASGAQLTISSDNFNNNAAIGGTGGAGGNVNPIDAFMGAKGGNGGSGGAGDGGGVYASKVSLTLTGVSFANDTAVGGQGGGGGESGGLDGGGGGGGGGGGAVGPLGNMPVTILIDTVFSQDTAASGAAGPGGNPGEGIFPQFNGPAVTLSTATLPSGTVGTNYGPQTITALPAGSLDSNPTLSYKPSSPTLGLNFSVSASGNQLTISGTPTAAGTVTFTVTATDSEGSTTPLDYSLTINPLPGGGGNGTGGNGSGGGVSGTDGSGGGGSGGGSGVSGGEGSGGGGGGGGVGGLIQEIITEVSNLIVSIENYISSELSTIIHTIDGLLSTVFGLFSHPTGQGTNSGSSGSGSSGSGSSGTTPSIVGTYVGTVVLSNANANILTTNPNPPHFPAQWVSVSVTVNANNTLTLSIPDAPLGPYTTTTNYNIETSNPGDPIGIFGTGGSDYLPYGLVASISGNQMGVNLTDVYIPNGDPGWPDPGYLLSGDFSLSTGFTLNKQ